MFNSKILRTLVLAGGLLAAFAGQATVVTTYAGPSKANVDTSFLTSTSFNIADAGIVQNLTAFVNIGGSWADDITVWLSHLGTTVKIYTGNGDTPGAVINATFSDAAIASAPFSGSAIGVFKSVDLLSAFNGQNVAGLWTLQTQDFVIPGDGNFLNSWGITVTTGNAVPEPASLALFGLALAGLAVSRRRKI